MKRLLILLCVGSMLCPLPAQRTSRRNLSPAQEDVDGPAPVVCDTIVLPRPHVVDINGYDKPLRSRRESFFVTNNSDSTVCGIAFTINYFDTQRRQLHSDKKNIVVELPAGETRQVSYSSWDKQQSFYYVRSAVPQRAEQATPYEVTIRVDTLFVR